MCVHLSVNVVCEELAHADTLRVASGVSICLQGTNPNALRVNVSILSLFSPFPEVCTESWIFTAYFERITVIYRK